MGRRTRRARRRPRVRGDLPGTRSSSPRSPAPTAPATSATTSRWCRTPSAASPRTSFARSPSTSTATTPTFPRRSSPDWPRWGPSDFPSPRSTAASHPAATPTTSPWSSPPRSCPRGSLGAGGSLITRPEILARALEAGGTEEQKHEWLPKLATAEVMNAVAVTEPDYGSDVAGVKVAATPAQLDGVEGWLDQRCQDVVHLRRPRRCADAARPHRSRSFGRTPRAVDVHRAQAARRGTRVRGAAGRDGGSRLGQDGGPGDRHHRLPGHALLRGLPRGLVRAGGQPDRRRGRQGQGLLLPDGRIRERAPPDRSAGHRRHAGRLRSGDDLCRGSQRLRPAHRRVPAHPGQADPDGRADPGRPTVQLRRRAG